MVWTRVPFFKTVCHGLVSIETKEIHTTDIERVYSGAVLGLSLFIRVAVGGLNTADLLKGAWCMNLFTGFDGGTILARKRLLVYNNCCIGNDGLLFVTMLSYRFVGNLSTLQWESEFYSVVLLVWGL